MSVSLKLFPNNQVVKNFSLMNTQENGSIFTPGKHGPHIPLLWLEMNPWIMTGGDALLAEFYEGENELHIIYVWLPNIIYANWIELLFSLLASRYRPIKQNRIMDLEIDQGIFLHGVN